ncbi:MAG: right-handed parallel beta-helix repeat-containing protein, partial [Bacteroidota bacterium]|nr:right-handed parallel beta-helix repeat-containing protein [Bacteroidota bacterium]
MKRFIKKSILILCLAVLMAFSFASESVSFLKGDINDDEKIDLSESVHALQVVAGLKTSNMTKIINVPSDFPTIQEAINMAVAGDTINIVAGTYNEKLTIMKSNIKLQGAGRDSTIINGNSTTDPTISILNSTGIEISDFLIKGGRYGIRLQYSSVSCKNNRIENNTKFGVRAFYNSFIEIGNTLIKLTDGGGISVDDGAVAWIDKSEITQNTGRGLSATSAGFEVTECIITNNGENGIQSHDSSVRIYDSVISNNTGDGIDAWNGSRITLYGTEVKSNTDCGLMIGGHSTAHLG